MDRAAKFMKFCEEYSGRTFMGQNISKIHDNLEMAEKNGALKDFILNKKPYQSAFAFFNGDAARGKDQVAIVVALNVYGADHPGFAVRLNRALKEVARGSAKQAQNVTVLMAAQMEFQRKEISLSNFVDRELIELVNKRTKRNKGKMIAFWCLIGGASSMGAPGFAMLGVPLLSIPCAVLCFYSIFMKVVYWACLPVFKEDVISASVRTAGDCVIQEQISEKIVCNQCGSHLDATDKFCAQCGTPR